MEYRMYSFMLSAEMHNEIMKLRETLEKQAECMQMLLEHSKERDTKMEDVVKQINEIAQRNDEMYKPFKDSVLVAKWVSFGIKWLFGTMLAIGGAYIMLKQIFPYGDN